MDILWAVFRLRTVGGVSGNVVSVIANVVICALGSRWRNLQYVVNWGDNFLRALALAPVQIGIINWIVRRSRRYTQMQQPIAPHIQDDLARATFITVTHTACSLSTTIFYFIQLSTLATTLSFFIPLQYLHLIFIDKKNRTNSVSRHFSKFAALSLLWKFRINIFPCIMV